MVLKVEEFIHFIVNTLRANTGMKKIYIKFCVSSYFPATLWQVNFEIIDYNFQHQHGKVYAYAIMQVHLDMPSGQNVGHLLLMYA